MSDASNVLKMIKDNEVKYVDLRFTDPRGKMQHVTLDIDLVDEDFFNDGAMFDGSSIAGWKAVKHDADARPVIGAPRPVLCATDAFPFLQYSGAEQRRKLQSRPTLNSLAR